MGFSINSKTTKKIIYLLPLKEKNDGHDFLNQAIKNGANYCVISKTIKKIKIYSC